MSTCGEPQASSMKKTPELRNFRSKSVSYAETIRPKSRDQLMRTKSEPQSSPTDDQEDKKSQAARRKSIETIGLHYYPEGGWGWVICACGFVVNFVVSGFYGASGSLYLKMIENFGKEYVLQSACVIGASLGMSSLLSPVIIGLCRRKNNRPVAFIGGLMLSLGCLFSSFTSQFHQMYISFGLLFPIGCAMSRDAASYMIGQYFKRKRELIEMIMQIGSGTGIIFFSLFNEEVLSYLGWRHGLQVLCAISSTTYIVSAFHRSAGLYHPQRRAILHLKSMQKRSKHFRDKVSHQDKVSLFDVQSLKSRSLQGLILSSSLASLGLHSPLVFLIMDVNESSDFQAHGYKYIVVFLGLAYVIGSCAFCFLVLHRATDCLISRSYLCISSLLVLGLLVTSYKTALTDYNGKVIFACIFGVFFAGYNYSIRMVAIQTLKPRMFDRGFALINFSVSFPQFIGIPLTVYLNLNLQGAGYYFSAVSLLLATLSMFVFQLIENSSRQMSNINSPACSTCRRCSDVSSSLGGPTSRRSSSSTHNTSGSTTQTTLGNSDSSRSQHKIDMKRPELTCISEEGCVDNISEAYQYYGDCITSCSNEERFIGISEFENNFNQTCENIVMDQSEKMTRVRKKSVVNKSPEMLSDTTCSECRKFRPVPPNGKTLRIFTPNPLHEAAEEDDSKNET